MRKWLVVVFPGPRDFKLWVPNLLARVNRVIALFWSLFKDTLKAFDDFRSKQKSEWSNVFWYVKVCIFWNCIQYTIHWHKTKMFKKFPLDRVSGTKNALFSSFARSKFIYFCSTKCVDSLALKRHNYCQN